VDARTWKLALNTLLLSGATCAISLPVGTVLAWLLLRTDLPVRRIGMMLLGLMLFVPLYLHAAAWQAAFGVQGWCTLSYGVPAWLDRWPGAIWVHAVAAIPWVVLIVGVGLLLIEPELEEQALLDGSSRQVFCRVTLPAALPAVGAAALWIALATAGEMTVTDLMRVRTYAEEVYTQLAIGQEPGEAALEILPGAALSALLVAAGLMLCAALAPRDRPPSWQHRWVFRLGRLRGPITLLTAAAILLLVGLPLGSLCYKAGVVVSPTEAGPVRSWSPVKCQWMIAAAPWRYRGEFGWSLLIGTLAAAGAVAAAIPLAWWARRDGWRALPLVTITAVCLAVPGPIVGLAAMWLLNRPDSAWLRFLYDRSILAPWLALMVRGLPAATLVLWHALRTVPAELLESAAVDGAGPLARLWRVALGSRWSAVAVAFLVTFAVVLGDLAASILVVPPGVTTLSIQVFGLLHYGVEDQAAGICLALILLFAAVACAVAWLVRGGARDERKVGRDDPAAWGEGKYNRWMARVTKLVQKAATAGRAKQADRLP